VDLFLDFGLIGLFIAAFLAATILPLSSEFLLGALILTGEHPLPVIIVATAGNVLGSLLSYYLGLWLKLEWLQRWFGVSAKSIEKAADRFRRFGMWTLCFTWVPIIGDPLCVIAGLFRVRVLWFLLIVSITKCMRYSIISYAIYTLH